jgi:hypothetical protein
MVRVTISQGIKVAVVLLISLALPHILIVVSSSILFAEIR